MHIEFPILMPYFCLSIAFSNACEPNHVFECNTKYFRFIFVTVLNCLDVIVLLSSLSKYKEFSLIVFKIDILFGQQSE